VTHHLQLISAVFASITPLTLYLHEHQQKLLTASKQLSDIAFCHFEHLRKSHDAHLSCAAVQVGPLVGCGVGSELGAADGCGVGAWVATVTTTPEICSADGIGTTTPWSELASTMPAANDAGVRLAALAAAAAV